LFRTSGQSIRICRETRAVSACVPIPGDVMKIASCSAMVPSPKCNYTLWIVMLLHLQCGECFGVGGEIKKFRQCYAHHTGAV
jgi:hypothetical protein